MKIVIIYLFFLNILALSNITKITKITKSSITIIKNKLRHKIRNKIFTYIIFKEKKNE